VLEREREYPQSAHVRWILRNSSHKRFALAVVILMACANSAVRVLAADTGGTSPSHGPFFFPTGAAAKIVTVTLEGEAEAGITVVTQGIAEKETASKPVITMFGEVYIFSPSFIAVHRDQPTQIEFWNLQPDDEHDFALVGPDLKILMYQRLPPLQKTSFVFTFHREGVIDFKCLRHQPEMSGQILVLPPSGP
jgi:plastocyanin